jgi:DNA-binding response OmpR family regulator
MPISPSVLLLGHDPDLLKTRQWVLESAGLRVQVATTFKALNMALQDSHVDLLVLCHSLSAKECDGVVATIRSHYPELNLMLLEKSNMVDRALSDSHSITHGGTSPKLLVDSIKRLTGESGKLH